MLTIRTDVGFLSGVVEPEVVFVAPVVAFVAVVVFVALVLLVAAVVVFVALVVLVAAVVVFVAPVVLVAEAAFAYSAFIASIKAALSTIALYCQATAKVLPSVQRSAAPPETDQLARRIAPFAAESKSVMNYVL